MKAISNIQYINSDLAAADPEWQLKVFDKTGVYVYPRIRYVTAISGSGGRLELNMALVEYDDFQIGLDVEDGMSLDEALAAVCEGMNAVTADIDEIGAYRVCGSSRPVPGTLEEIAAVYRSGDMDFVGL